MALTTSIKLLRFFTLIPIRGGGSFPLTHRDVAGASSVSQFLWLWGISLYSREEGIVQRVACIYISL